MHVHNKSCSAIVILTILCCVLLGIIIALAILYAQDESKLKVSGSLIGNTTSQTTPIGSTTSTKSSVTFCKTTGCIGASDLLQQYIDPSIDPCEDFYLYACGTWIANNPIPPSQNRMDQKTVAMGKIKDEIVAKLSKIDDTDSSTPDFVKAAKMVYYNCVNQLNGSTNAYDWGTKINSTLVDTLNIGGWPMIQTYWNPPINFSIYESMASLLLQGTQTFLSITVDVDWSNVSSNAIYIDQAVLGLGNRRSYLEQPLDYNIVSYSNKILSTAKDLAVVDVAVRETDVADLIAFETELARITASNADRFSISLQNNRYTFDQLLHRFPGIPWNAIMSKLFPDNITSYEGVFVVNEPGYVDSLTALISNTEYRVLANYLGWRFVNSLLSYKSGSFKPGQLQLDLGPQDAEVACTILLAEQMTFALAYVYIFNNPPNQNELAAIKDNVKVALSEYFKTLRWLDDTSLHNYQKKLDQMVENLMYPSWITNVTYLTNHFAEVSEILFSTNDFYYQLEQMRRFTVKQNLNKMFKSPVREEFSLPPIEIFAVYMPSHNAFTIANGMTTEPYWNHSWPMAIQYGGIGWLVARNMLKGYTQEGIQFVANGSVADMLSRPSRSGFNRDMQCLINQYSTYCYPPPLSMCLDGPNTQGENMCDNAGLRVALDSYNSWAKNNQVEDERLPAFPNLTQQQLFFLGFAIPWCRNASTEATQAWILQDTHSPAEWRVRGSVRNIPEFGDTFQCKKSDPMYPKEENRCRIGNI